MAVEFNSSSSAAMEQAVGGSVADMIAHGAAIGCTIDSLNLGPEQWNAFPNCT